MKHKRLAVTLIVAGLLAIIGVASSNWHQFFPSPQMKALRQLEAKLDLPKPKYRTETDAGYNQDAKGASHYDRRIALSYQDVSVLDMLRSKLLQDSWREQPVGEPIGANTYFSFVKGAGDGMQCVHGFFNASDPDTKLYVSLEAAGEYSCDPDAPM